MLLRPRQRDIEFPLPVSLGQLQYLLVCRGGLRVLDLVLWRFAAEEKRLKRAVWGHIAASARDIHMIKLKPLRLMEGHHRESALGKRFHFNVIETCVREERSKNI